MDARQAPPTSPGLPQAGLKTVHPPRQRNPASLASRLLLALLLGGFALPALAASKILYLTTSSGLTRTPQASSATSFSIASNGTTFKQFTLTPVLQKNLVLTAGSTITFTLSVQRTGNNSNRTFSVTFLDNGTTTICTTPNSAAFNNAGAVVSLSVSCTLGGSNVTVPSGDTLVVQVNNTTGVNTRPFSVFPNSATAGASTATLVTSTFINVDSVTPYAAAYSSVATQGSYAPGSTVYIRAVISDPFGSYDVDPATGGTAPTVSIKDANNTAQLAATAMTQVADSGADNMTFEYAYTVPGGAVAGTWVPTVVATEGTEGTVTANASGSFVVAATVSTDLAISKSHSGNFSAGANARYTLTVTNNGPAAVPATYLITVTDSLPATENYVSTSGSGWSCSFSSPTVTCTNSSGVASGGSLPAITLNVTLTAGATSPVSNTASVSSAAVTDGTAGNNSSTDNATVTRPNYATSTKTWVDLNGGDVAPGDTVEYTITVTDTGSAVGNNIEVTDNIPTDISSYSLVSIPGGSTNNSTGSGTGSNGTGYIDISGISISSGGSVTIVYDVVVSGSAAIGDSIANSATIIGGTTSPVTVTATTITVQVSQVPGSGNKTLYAYDDASLTRTPQTAGSTGIQIAGNNINQDFTLTPVLQKNLVLTAGTNIISASVVLRRITGGTSNNRTVTVSLRTGSGTQIAIATAQTFNSTTATLYTFNMTLAANFTVNSGDTVVLRINNNSAGAANRPIRFDQWTSSTNFSRVAFTTSTVINVDSVNAYSAVYPSTSTPSNSIFEPNLQYVYIRAVVSDPFGCNDIFPAGGTAPTLTLTDPNGTVRLSAVTMTQAATLDATNCNAAAVATKVFEYYASGTNGYTVANNGAEGFWTPTVTATEGTETPAVTHTANGSFEVRRPSLVVLKLVTLQSDPVNNSTNPKSIPGAVEQYTIQVSNTGKGRANAVVITDAIPSNTTYVPGSVSFVQGSPTSGLSSPTVSWDNTNCSGTFAASESTSAKCVKFAWTNTDFMNGSSGSSPSFQIKFNVTVN